MLRLIVLTDRRQADLPLETVVAEAALGGARLVVLREKDLPTPERAELAARLLRVLRPLGARLLVAGPAPGIGGAAGIHLAAADPWPAGPGGSGGPGGPGGPGGSGGPGRLVGLVGRSCHSPTEVVAAAAGGAHYATLSPIFPTPSKPGYGPPLGTGVLGTRLPLPVYALGGIGTPEQARACLAAGAAGVAVMGAVMRAADPAAVTRGFLLAVAPPRPAGRARWRTE